MVSFFFFQETNSSAKDEKYGVMNSKDSYFSLMEKTTPVVSPLFSGAKTVNILNINCDNLGCILVIVVKIDGSVLCLY